VWDAHLTYVYILFLIYVGALLFQKLPVGPNLLFYPTVILKTNCGKKNKIMMKNKSQT
jgi:hypothetical protein